MTNGYFEFFLPFNSFSTFELVSRPCVLPLFMCCVGVEVLAPSYVLTTEMIVACMVCICMLSISLFLRFKSGWRFDVSISKSVGSSMSVNKSVLVVLVLILAMEDFSLQASSPHFEVTSALEQHAGRILSTFELT